MLAGQEIQGRENTHYLFLVLLAAGRMLEMGPEEPALRWLPRVQRAQALCPERWPGGPQRGAPCAPLPPLPFQNLMQCFRVWGARPRENARLAAAIVSYPALTLTPQGLSPVPVPQTVVPS